MRILTAAQMRRADQRAIEEFGIPAASLMEAAGLQVVEAMEAAWGPAADRKVVVVCGKGNNGGDGYVAARHLVRRGAQVQILALATGEQLSEQSRQQESICIKSGIPIRPFSQEAPGGDWVMDAIFGTGFEGAPRGDSAEAIEWINRQDAAVVSVDLPSGCNADTGQVEGAAVQAGLCVALASAKPAHFLEPASGLCGRLVVKAIGIPPVLLNEAKPPATLFEPAMAAPLLPKRDPAAHKKSAGTVLLVAGSGEYPGAAALAARAAFRSGAGFLHVITPQAAAVATLEAMPEAVVHRLGDQVLDVSQLDAVLELASKAHAVVMGPGLGRGAKTQELARRLYEQLPVPTVVDADALVALAELEGASPKAPRLLTPHTAEAAAMLGQDPGQVEANRPKASREAATRFEATVLLKGPHSLVAGSGGELSFNSTGNAVLATAGSGDVLSGLLGALMAQGLTAWDAARLGAWLHGLAGDAWRKRHGETGMTATDLSDLLPGAADTARRLLSNLHTPQKGDA